MKKHLSLLMLLAALIVPWAAHAQGTTINTFPWTCNFEDTTENQVWTISNASPNGWHFGTATHNGAGSHALYVSDNGGTSANYSGSACVSYAYVTFDITNPGQYALQFDWQCAGESSYDYLRVALASATTALPTSYSDWGTTTVPSNFIAVDGGSKLNLGGTSWNTQTTVINVTTAGTYNLVFVWRNDGSVYNQPPAAIDNIVVTELTCPQPMALSAIPSADQLELSWTPGGSETEWIVVLNDTSETYVYDTTYTITNLQSNTPYTVKVYAVCGAGDTSLATVGNYRTSCAYISTVPVTEDFESYGSGSSVFPTCWYKLGSTADRPYIHATTSYGHNNSHGLYFYAAAGGYCYGIMPPVDPMLDLTTLQVSFWARQYSTSYNCDFVVGVMTDPTNESTFVAIDTVHPAGTTYEVFDVPLVNYTGTGNYIAFRAIQHPGTSTDIYMMLDDVTLQEIPACPRPVGLVVDGVTPDSVYLHINDAINSEWVVVYGPTGFNPDTAVVNVINTTVFSLSVGDLTSTPPMTSM